MDYENSIEDLLTLNQYLSAREGRQRRNRRIAIFAIGFVLLGGAVGWGAAPWSTAWPLFLFVGAMAVVALTVGPFLERRSIRHAVERGWEEDQHLGTQQLELRETGVHHRSSRGGIERPWADVSEVVVEADVLLLLFGEAAAHVVPRRVFSSEDAFARFAEGARGLWEGVEAG